MASISIIESFDSPGNGPAGLAWDGRALWNADFTTGHLFAVDPESGEVVRSLVCPGNLSGLAWDGRSLWQSLHEEGMLRRINPETNDFDQTIALPGHGWLSGVAWDGRNLWAVSQQKGELLAVERQSGRVVQTLPAPVASGGWLLNYEAATPGVQVADNVTVRLDMDNEPQPDAFLRLKEQVGGQSSLSADDYLEGAPELIIEVAASTATYDLHDKMNVYRRNRVQEYVVLLTREQKTLWYALEEGTYHLLQPEDGVLKSRVFPGLHLHVDSYWNEDLPDLLKYLQEGLDSPEHAAFIKQLQERAS